MRITPGLVPMVAHVVRQGCACEQVMMGQGELAGPLLALTKMCSWGAGCAVAAGPRDTA